MPEKPLRIALVGAGTLLGKALNDELAASVFASADFHLLDDDETAGKLSTASDEMTLIQRIEAESFHRCDFTFFAGSRELTKEHWRQALKAGSSIVDLSGELEGAPGILVRYLRSPRQASKLHSAVPEDGHVRLRPAKRPRHDRHAVNVIPANEFSQTMPPRRWSRPGRNARDGSPVQPRHASPRVRGSAARRAAP